MKQTIYYFGEKLSFMIETDSSDEAQALLDSERAKGRACCCLHENGKHQIYSQIPEEAVRFQVANIDTEEIYFVSGWEEGRDSTDKSAIQEAIKLNDTITMGKVIVTPIRFTDILDELNKEAQKDDLPLDASREGSVMHGILKDSQKASNELKEVFGDVISKYTDDEAVDDGLLVPVEDLLPITYMTAGVYAKCIEPFVLKDVITGRTIKGTSPKALTKKLITRIISAVSLQISDGSAPSDDWMYKVDASGWEFFVVENQTGFTVMFPEEY